MEWIALIVLVFAVIVPVVLLFGFAGCAQLIGQEDLEFPPPTFSEGIVHLDGTATGENSIQITWGIDSLPGATSPVAGYTVTLQRTGGTKPFTPTTIAGGTYDDTSLDPGTMYTYTIVAKSSGFKDSSASLVVWTWAHWNFHARTSAPVDIVTFPKICLLQTVPADTKMAPGSTLRVKRVVLTVRASRTDLTITNASIALFPGPGGQPWDSQTPTILPPFSPKLTALKDVSTTIVVRLPYGVTFMVPSGRALLVAFDIESGEAAAWGGTAEPYPAMRRAGVEEAGQGDRTGPYDLIVAPLGAVLLEKLEFSIEMP